ncbi:MAG: hypothetical protein QM493_04490 [Sulfurovum sp.]
MLITKHGYKRIKERVGLPKRAHFRHIKSVLHKGELYSREGFTKFEMIYHGFLYIFALSVQLEPILVTTYRVEI